MPQPPSAGASPPPANKGKVNDPGFGQADKRKSKKKVWCNEAGVKVYEETEHDAEKDFAATDRGSK